MNAFKKVALVGFVVAFAGCSGGSSSSPDVTLHGTYQAVGDGPYSRMTFLDGEHFTLQKSACTEDCTETGTYALVDASTVLRLRDDITGETVDLPFSDVEPAPAVDPTESGDDLRPLDDLTNPTGALTASTSPGIQSFHAGTQLFTHGDALTWQTVGFGIGGITVGSGKNILIVYGGYTATDQDSRALAIELTGTKSFSGLDVGPVYAARGPKHADYRDHEIGNPQLMTALKSQAAAASSIIVIAHSSGAVVGNQLVNEAPGDVLSKIVFFALDGGTSFNNAIVSKMKAVTFVYAKDAVEGESMNAGAMKLEHSQLAASHLFMVDADGSGCHRNAGWCLHDTLITSRPHNPATFDIALDYQDFTGGRHVVSSYIDQAVTNKVFDR